MADNYWGFHEMTRDEILSAHPLTEYLASRGVELRRNATNICPLGEHRRNHLCVSIQPERQLWMCHDHGQGGSIIDWIMHETGKPLKTVMDELEGANGMVSPPRFKNSTTGDVEQRSATPVGTYDYVDESGKLIFQVCRYEPKTFRQRQPDGDGWKWGLDGITRILFNLPKVLNSSEIIVVEGEKDCQTLDGLGLTATTNAGGSSGWLPAYAQFLKGKDVIVIPDSDPAGAKHAEAVLASISGTVNSVKVVSLPAKDVTDYVGTFRSKEAAQVALTKLIEETPHKIAPLPVYSIAEMEADYRKFVRTLNENAFDLSKFLPELGVHVRKIVPGELILVMANTGVGKSAITQAMARAASPLPTLFFELELPLPLMFERFVQMEIGCYSRDVEQEYREHDDNFSSRYHGLSHIYVCPESGLNTAQIENYITRSQLKIGSLPKLVIVDYIGLVREQGKSRYEQVSSAAEQLKVIAKKTNTIVIMASQISRPDKQRKETLEVGLHSGKESGSLENSAGLILGCWRPEKDKLCIKILKNTKGSSGHIIEAKFDGAKMAISPYPDL